LPGKQSTKQRERATVESDVSYSGAVLQQIGLPVILTYTDAFSLFTG